MPVGGVLRAKEVPGRGKEGHGAKYRNRASACGPSAYRAALSSLAAPAAGVWINEERSLEMIVVVGRVRTDADRRADLVRIGQAIARTSRGEDGCLGYRMYEDSEAENEFVFVEEWESQEALQRHFGMPHVAEFMRAIPAAIVGPPDVRFHTVASTVDLADLNVSI